ncbi:hypothetical protein FHT00_001583 [Sphingomonas insulae]|uniref:Uncharacterized protein n=1 Tax=Sphingomonas insulae TaxID=424800 RepID=A0ABN1HY96_9SPHN|nr:hypothetical protein [Sphingomonas insulae]NIJ29636.1 hypothetical protein [Sphingomonas insulae]
MPPNIKLRKNLVAGRSLATRMDIANRKAKHGYSPSVTRSGDFVECMKAYGEPTDAAATQCSLTIVFDDAADLPSPAYHIAVKVQGAPAKPTDLKALRRDLTRWIGRLPKDKAAAKRADRWFGKAGGSATSPES